LPETLKNLAEADLAPTDTNPRRVPLAVLVVTVLLVGVGIAVVWSAEYVAIAADIWL
jgi:hypothetical protein